MEAMNWVEAERWVEFGIFVAREVAKLTPNKVDDVLPEVLAAIWQVLRPTFQRNGAALELEPELAELALRLADQAPV